MMHFQNYKIQTTILSVALSLTLAPHLMPAALAQNSQTAPVAQATVKISGTEGKKISPDLLGIFFEDINYAADGGLYAELVQNRSFEYSPADRQEWNSLTSWELVQRGGGKGSVKVESGNALHLSNPNYAVLSLEQGGTGVGLMNSGFDGIVLKAGEKYNFSCFARLQSGQPMPLVVTLESKTGTVYGTAMLSNLSQDWAKHSATIQVTNSDPDARLVIGTRSVGAIALDMVSLFPQKTFHNRPNGLRADLAQTIADLHPKFVRFPGGCISHGAGLHNIYNWKDTIGPAESRRGQRNLWGYHQSVGLGYHEYFQFCEDIGAKPLPVVAAGVTCGFAPGGQQCIPVANMKAYVQDLLDLVEYANGPVTSTWGAKRAAAGHPKPFNVQYLGVGNEDSITPEFRQRFEMIYKAIKAKYPKIEVIGNSGAAPGGPNFDDGWKFANQLSVPTVDEHYYMAPEWFLNNLNRYDSYDRKGPKVYVGEWASQGNSLFNALSEAAYLASMERNGDVVNLASYAPLLSNTRHQQWGTNLIYFDNTQVAPSANYYVQQLYGQHSGDTYLPTNVSLSLPVGVPKVTPPVSAFLGTWNTQAQFEQVRLESGPDSVLNSPTTGADWDWSEKTGTWKTENGTYSQTGEANRALFKVPGARVAGEKGKASYTYSLRAKKTSGAEGFLIGFGATDPANYYWWNLGGWGNTQHGVERFGTGGSGLMGKAVPGRIETGRWYDIKIVVNGQHIQCFLDGKLIHDIQDTTKSADEILVASSVRDTKSGDIILKLVNVTPYAVQSQINLPEADAVKPVATRVVLSGDLGSVNSFENPRKITPQTSEIRVGKSFAYEAPPHSLSVIRMKTR